MSIQAYICDAVRTPIGRYGGALASVRTDDLGAVPIKALMRAQPGRRLGGGGRRDLRLRQPGRRGQPQRRAHGALLAGLPVERARRDRQPPVRVRPGRGRHRGARDQVPARPSSMIAGGVESMIARALRHGQGRERRSPRRADLRHDDRLALRQPADEGAIRRRLDAGDRPRTSPRSSGIARDDQDALRARAASSARCAAQAAGFFDGEIVPVTIRAKKGEPIVVTTRRASAADTTLEALAKLPTPFRADGTVTAGNASGVNDGACALLLAQRGGGARSTA